MKKMINKIMQKFGFEIVRINNDNKKSVRTDRQSFYKTKTGNYYLPTDACSDEIANAIKNNKIYDKSVYEIAKKYIKPGTVAIDIGANFGQMTVLMADLVGRGG